MEIVYNLTPSQEQIQKQLAEEAARRQRRLATLAAGPQPLHTSSPLQGFGAGFEGSSTPPAGISSSWANHEPVPFVAAPGLPLEPFCQHCGRRMVRGCTSSMAPSATCICECGRQEPLQGLGGADLHVFGGCGMVFRVLRGRRL